MPGTSRLPGREGRIQPLRASADSSGLAESAAAGSGTWAGTSQSTSRRSGEASRVEVSVQEPAFLTIMGAGPSGTSRRPAVISARSSACRSYCGPTTARFISGTTRR